MEENKIEQKKIGTVEPFKGYSKWNFITGAILKYSDNPQYEESLTEYIMKMLKQK